MKTIFSLLIYCFTFFYTTAQVSVVTQHNDNGRTGANLAETKLDISNVDTLHFGKLCDRIVDDDVYAQPLVVSGVNIPGFGPRNVLYIATVNNSVYAYDADDRLITSPYWQVNLTPAGSRVIQVVDYNQAGTCGGDFRDFSNNIGIVSTPVIDTATQTIYVVTKNKVTLNGDYQQWLHALDLRNGTEKQNSPVMIEASMAGTGDGNVNGTMYFNAFHLNQRAALLLVNGVIYITWAGYCDWTPYNGWILGYDAQTLQRVVTWSTNRNGMAGGIWMSGGGISADADGNLYACSGNGTVGLGGNPADLSNRAQSILKLTRSGDSLIVSSFFTPYNFDVLNQFDLDMGTCDVMLIPGTDMAVTAGKEGILYVANKDTMGGVDTIDHVRQKILLGDIESHNGSVFWHSDQADYVYIWPSVEQPLFRYEVNFANNTLDTASKTQSIAKDDFKPGGIISLSANGSQNGSGILWANIPLDWASIGAPNRPGILRAYDATDITHELWNSQMNPARDSIDNYAKFVAPTIANGKVYMATFSGRIAVYGIFNPDRINENEIDELADVFPNPSPGIVNILIREKNISAEISVFNSLGEKIIDRMEMNSQKIVLDLSLFPEGIYFVTVKTSKSVITKKIVRQE